MNDATDNPYAPSPTAPMDIPPRVSWRQHEGQLAILEPYRVDRSVWGTVVCFHATFLDPDDGHVIEVIEDGSTSDAPIVQQLLGQFGRKVSGRVEPDVMAESRGVPYVLDMPWIGEQMLIDAYITNGGQNGE